MECAQRSVEEAVRCVNEQLEALQGEHARLQSQHANLQSEHAELQEKYRAEADSWRQFKVWWHSAVEKKRSTRQTSSQRESASGSSTSPAAPSGEERRHKAHASVEDIAVLERVGLDCRDNAAAHVGEASTWMPVSAVKRREEEGRPFKKPRSSVKTESSSPHRLPLEEIGNRSTPSTHARDVVSPIAKEAGDREVLQEALKRERRRKIQDLKQDPLKHKGRGRYSTGLSTSDQAGKTINDEFEIDKERNGNVGFLHKQVVRDKRERKQMHAHDCECCSEWYKAVGEAPLRRFQDPRSVQACGELGEQDGEGKRQAHRQQISRHRAYGPPASTPPYFWELAFPDTQKQQEVNQLAREEHEKKRDQIAKDPRYKRRS